MSRTILSLGYHHYILPASANVNTLLKSLAGAIEVEERWHDGEHFYTPKQPLALAIKVVSPRFILDGKRKMIPEKCGPEPIEELL